MVTVVTGSHSIGGFRHLSSPGLAGAFPYVPFDCTTAANVGDNTRPFDNNVFKVACDGVQGVVKGPCNWNEHCSNPAVDQATCPFRGIARGAFEQADPNSYPNPGSNFGRWLYTYLWDVFMLLLGPQQACRDLYELV